jgi:flagellar basal-body rod protein FlgF
MDITANDYNAFACPSPEANKCGALEAMKGVKKPPLSGAHRRESDDRPAFAPVYRRFCLRLPGPPRAFLGSEKNMDPLTGAATSGLRTSLESLDMLSNNLANVTTTGFKSDREFFDLYTSADSLEPGAYDPTQMPTIQRNWTDFSQGLMQHTGNDLDVGILGEGFFSVNGPSGKLYTRNGAFVMSPTGQLITQEGYPVTDRQGKPIKIDPVRDIEIDTKGGIHQAGQTVGQLDLVSFADLHSLSKQGATYFKYNGSDTDIKVAPGEVQQDRIESSNVGSAESAVRLVSVMRQFEMLQKAIGIGTDMNKEALEEVARSGQ